jgi:hypothetical protein
MMMRIITMMIKITIIFIITDRVGPAFFSP